MEEKDISDVLQIWLETNIKAHSFIDKEYWTGNYETVSYTHLTLPTTSRV